MDLISAYLYTLLLVRHSAAKTQLGDGRPVEDVCCLELLSPEPAELLLFFFDPLNHSWSSVVSATA